jgi:hypothetical protein
VTNVCSLLTTGLVELVGNISIDKISVLRWAMVSLIDGTDAIAGIMVIGLLIAAV